MTIASTARKAGPFTGNGIQSAWPFTFKVFAPADVRATLADGNGAETVLVLDADYTVTLNSNQETSPGGTVNYLLAGGSRLVITSKVSYDQPLDLPSGGNYNPQALENQLDRTVMQIQQLSEELGRAVKVPVTEQGGDGELSGELARGILALVPEIDAINAVVDELPAVVAVADKTTAVQSVADNLASVTNFADVYLGAKTSDPLVRNDGTALQTGDLYFSVPGGVMRIYGAGGWANIGEAIPITISSSRFNGTGAQTTFTLPTAPAFEAACDVYISGVHQVVDIDYNVTGTSLVFTSAPPVGTGNIEVKIFSPISVGVPNNGSVTTEKLGDGAVTAGKAVPTLVEDLLGFTPADADDVAYDAAVTAALASKADTSALTAGLATKANLAGNSGQAFAVGTATNSEHALRRDQVNVANAAVVKTAVNAAGDPPIYACRAWVNFQGTGTVAIRASGNVASITDVGPGFYDVVFATPMPDVNYATILGSGNNDAGTHGSQQAVYHRAPTTTFVAILTADDTGQSGAEDCPWVDVAIFR